MPIMGMDLSRRPKDWSPEASMDLLEFLDRRKGKQEAKEAKPAVQPAQAAPGASRAAAMEELAETVERKFGHVEPMGAVDTEVPAQEDTGPELEF